ncbi:hypothetical protein FQZ97_626190 [compost metagenome]
MEIRESPDAMENADELDSWIRLAGNGETSANGLGRQCSQVRWFHDSSPLGSGFLVVAASIGIHFLVLQ